MKSMSRPASIAGYGDLTVTQPLEEGPVGRVEQRTIGVEGTVLDDDGDFADFS